MPNMPNKPSSSGVNWFPLIAILVLVAAFSSGATGGIFRLGGGGAQTGSKSKDDTVEEITKRKESLGRSEGTVEESARKPTPTPTGEPTPTDSVKSQYDGKVRVSTGRAKETISANEYVDITTRFLEKNEKINITGWRLENSKGERFIIEGGTYVVFPGQINSRQSIILESGSKVHIITGTSPIGANFQTNLCTGYLNQYNKFQPALRNECPRPEDEKTAQNLQDECIEFLEDLPRCQAPTNINATTLLTCQNYANQEINYSKCVLNHRNDADFFKKEWYVYLGRSVGIWKEKKETITLKDSLGKIISTVTY